MDAIFFTGGDPFAPAVRALFEELFGELFLVVHLDVWLWHSRRPPQWKFVFSTGNSGPGTYDGVRNIPCLSGYLTRAAACAIV